MNTLPSSFIEALRGIVGPEAILPPDQTTRYAVDGMVPQAVVTPKTVEELARVLGLSWQGDVAVTPWGGGTRIEIGNLPKRLDLVIVLNRLNRIVAHSPGDLTVSVEAGVTIASLQDMLAEHGQFLPLDPPLPHQATVGGTLASNAIGPLMWRYGLPRDLVVGMRVVQADGTVTRSGGQVVKNVTGYDMARLHVGGLGTLGIIVEVSFKLVPFPKDERTLWARFPSLGDCLNTSMTIFQGHTMPLAMTAFNADVAERLDSIARVASPEGASFLAVRLAGRPLAVERQARDVLDMCHKNTASRVESLSPAEGKILWRSLADLGWGETSPPTMSTRTSLLPTQASALMAWLEGLNASQVTKVAWMCHMGSGLISAHWYNKDGEDSLKNLTSTLKMARERAKSLEGHMTVERCPLSLKGQIDVWGDVGDNLSIMRRMKAQYDPKGILNPGRFVGGI